MAIIIILMVIAFALYFLSKDNSNNEKLSEIKKQKTKKKCDSNKKSLVIMIHLNGGDEYDGKSFEINRDQTLYNYINGVKGLKKDWDFWQITSNNSNHAFEWLRKDNNNISALNFWQGNDLSEIRKNISEETAIDIIMDSKWIPGLNKLLQSKSKNNNTKTDTLKNSDKDSEFSDDYYEYMSNKGLDEMKENFIKTKHLRTAEYRKFNQQYKIVDKLKIDINDFDLSFYKEVVGNLFISSEFKIKHIERKIKVGGSIISSVQNKKYDVAFYKQYFDFNEIRFQYKNGKWRVINFKENKDVLYYPNLHVSNKREYTEMLKKLKKDGSLNYSLYIKGNFKIFGDLKVINGDLDLTYCDFNSYDNIKLVKGDLYLNHKYKGLYSKPIVNGKTFHVRIDELINILDDGWSKDYDLHQIRRNNFNEIRASFEKVYEFVENKEFSKAYKEFNKIKYPDNIMFSGRNVYKDYEKGIKYPDILRYEGYEVWLLYFYNKNIIDIDVNFILKLCGFGKLITEIGKQYIEGLMPFLEDEIKNNSPYNLNTIDFNWVEDYFIRFLEHKNKKSPYHFNHHGFEDSKYEEMRIEIDRVFEETILASENKFRESKGIKRVGEYWVNETELYYKLKELFAEEDIVQHGNPKWLGEQHLDIYFPKHNIGVEYHGEQHFKAVKVFGGEEGLEKTKERDERKRRLCKKNSCHLIEIRKDYDIDGLTKKIKTLINN